jgi:hypothetical protein
MWFDDGASWHYEYISDTRSGYVNITVDGDTVINTIDAKKIRVSLTYFDFEEFQNFEDQFDRYEYMYADSDRVYQWINNEFVILYDFTVQVGDTIPLYLSDYDSTTINCDSTGIGIVTEIGLETINGQLLRYYSMTIFSQPTVVLFGKIIEKIGNTDTQTSGDILNYFFSQQTCDFIDIRGPFRCYSDNNFSTFSNPDYENNCDFLLAINEIKGEAFEFAVHPNPVSTQITVSFQVENNVFFSIKVFTLAGKELMHLTELYDQESIDVSNLNSGMYIIQVELDNGYRSARKFVKE